MYTNQFSSVNFPPLKEFLEITNLSKYSSKLKKLKCVEIEDLLSVLPDVHMNYIEEARLHRYIEHYTEQKLKPAISMEQPISLEDFFRKASLQTVFKLMKEFGVAEFDDLFCIKNEDMYRIIPKKIELDRYKRYLERYKSFEQNRKGSSIQSIDVENQIDIKSFLSEASLKKYKSDFVKLGVFEAEDLLDITPEDLPKMSKVEFERFLRYRHKQFGRMMQQKDTEECHYVNKEALDLHLKHQSQNQPACHLPISSEAADGTKSFNSQESIEGAASPMQTPIQEVLSSSKTSVQYSSPKNSSPLKESFQSEQETNQLECGDGVE